MNFAIFWQNNSVFMQKNHMVKKYHPYGKFVFQQLVSKNSRLSIKKHIYMCARTHTHTIKVHLKNISHEKSSCFDN